MGRPQPGRTGILALGLGLLLLGALLVDSPVVVAQRAHVEALLLPASPRTTGRLGRLVVDEGQHVNAGQVLAYLEAQDLDDEVARAEAALATAQAALPPSRSAAALRDSQRLGDVDQAVAAVEAARADLAAARARAAQAATVAATRRAGRQRGVMTEQEVVAAESDAQAHRAMAAAAEGRLQAAETALRLARRQAGLDSVERANISRAEADVRQAQAALAIARRRRASAAVVAPVDGTVARKLLVTGDLAQAGRAVMTLRADGDAWIQAEVRETDAPAVHVGTAATVTLDAHPDQVWHGHVIRSRVVAEPPDTSLGRPFPTVTVTIALNERPLPPGIFVPGLTARVSLARDGWSPWSRQQPSDPARP